MNELRPPNEHDMRLSALALMDSYLSQDYHQYRNIIDNTAPYELHGGLVSILVEVLGEYGAFLGMVPTDVIKVLRAEALAEL